jgi:hypothetical protein
LLFVAFSASSNAERVQVNCSFFIETTFNHYGCLFKGITIENDVNLNFSIGGEHWTGMTNEDVLMVKIEFASIPFIFKEIFETFSNLRRLVVDRGGLVTFQKNAFFKAQNLRSITIRNNFVPEVYPYAFIGATELTTLLLSDNTITKVHEHSLVGLNSLENLVLSNNDIEELPKNLLRPAIRLAWIAAGSNKFTKLDGDLFARKYQIYQIDFPQNQINAVSRSFMDNLDIISQIDVRWNACINRLFWIPLTSTLEEMREQLEPCFKNYDNLQGM